tara:strand:+ start:26127 stop:26657 length:531 start_codon:yes stop_codon:yes gene_type:complete
MGYTVYWNSSDGVKIEDAAPDIRELLGFCKGERPDINITPPELAGALTEFEPILTGTQLIFNGAGEEGAESFYLDDDQSGFGFCKTNRMPYDVAVKAALVLIQSHCDTPAQFRVGCDGSKMDWVPALTILHELFAFDPEVFLYSSASHVMTEREVIEQIESRWPELLNQGEQSDAK